MPHISRSSLVLLTTGLIMGAYFWYKRKKQNELLLAQNSQLSGEPPAQLPDWLSKKRVPVFLGIASLVSASIIFQANKTKLYIDNASDKDISISFQNEGTHIVRAGTYKMISVVKGDINAEYGNKKRKFIIPNSSKWVWNVDTLNSYIRTSVSYASNTDLYKNGKNPTEEKMPEYKIIHDEFFEAKVDYVFDVPEKISIKKRRFSSDGPVSKTVLYRFNENDIKEEAVTDTEPATDEPMDTVVVKSKTKSREAAVRKKNPQ
ncbi:MAG: hypothetical protein WAT19_09570 [Ferruginibacter sp.]